MARRRIELDLEKVKELAGLGLYHWQIAQALGISADTLERRMKEEPRLDQAVRQARTQVLTEMAGAVLAKAREGNLQAQLFILRSFTRRKEQVEIRKWDDLLSTVDLKQGCLSDGSAAVEEPWKDKKGI